MGVETLILGAAAAKFAGGIASEREGRKQASRAEEESREAATLRRGQIERQIGSNIAAFAKSGVLLQGSPLLAISEDIETGRKDIQAIEQTGIAQGKSLRASGRAALLGSIGGAASTASGAF